MSSTGLPNLTTATATSNTNSPSSAASSAAASSNTAKSTNTATATSGRASSGVSSATGLPNIGDSSTSVASSSSVSQITDAPSLSSSNGGGAILSLSGLPTLSGAFSYPPASVPPTSNAPYMRTTHLPQNLVFIVVGGVLAFMMLVVVIWRFLTAWSINRSFKKDSAAMYIPLPDLKKKPVKSDSGMDMADLSGSQLPKSFNSVPSLFFSPTAEVARQSMIRPQSQHMPGGHYRDASRG